MLSHLYYVSLIGALKSVGALGAFSSPFGVPPLDRESYTVTQLNARRFGKPKYQVCRVECRDSDRTFEFKKDKEGFHLTSIRKESETRDDRLDVVNKRLWPVTHKKKSANCEQATEQFFIALYEGDEYFKSEVDGSEQPVSAVLLANYIFKVVEVEAKIPPLEGLDVKRLFSKTEPERIRCRANVIGFQSKAFKFTLSRDRSVFTIENACRGTTRYFDNSPQPRQVQLLSYEVRDLRNQLVLKDSNKCMLALNSLYHKMHTSDQFALRSAIDREKSQKNTGDIFIDYMCSSFEGVETII